MLFFGIRFIINDNFYYGIYINILKYITMLKLFIIIIIFMVSKSMEDELPLAKIGIVFQEIN